MDDLPPRVRAVCDLDVAEAREYSGRHEYDGKIQDLSPGGVRDGLARLAEAASSGDRAGDPHDESHLAAFERRTQVVYGELELHRSNPLAHLAEMDLACYDREYAPAEERERAKLAHLALWPQAVDAALASLDQVSAPVASSLIGGIQGLAAGILDLRRKFMLEEMAGDNVMFAATGVTTGDYLRGVRFFSGGAMTNSVVMRSKTRTIRFIEAIHHFDFKPEY